LTAKFRQGQLTFVQPDTLQIPSHKTATLVGILQNIPKNKKVLVLDAEDINDNLKLASQSLSDQFKFMNVRSEKCNAYHVLNSSYVLLTTRALEHFESWLTKGL
jgi:ribosomal protein L4